MKCPSAVCRGHIYISKIKRGRWGVIQPELMGVRPVDAVTSIKVYNENIEHGAVTILSQQLDTIMYGVKGH